jgi:hypothetical protein
MVESGLIGGQPYFSGLVTKLLNSEEKFYPLVNINFYLLISKNQAFQLRLSKLSSYEEEKEYKYVLKAEMRTAKARKIDENRNSESEMK